MPGPAPRPRYPRATARIRAAHFPRKALKRGPSVPPSPNTILTETGNQLQAENGNFLRTEQ
jgi:hypothetical protein